MKLNLHYKGAYLQKFKHYTISANIYIIHTFL